MMVLKGPRRGYSAKYLERKVNEAYERAAMVAEGGRFLHDDAPDARFGKECAAAIRRLKGKPQ